MGASAAPVPMRVSYESLLGPAFDQGQTYECVCFALAGLKRYHEFKQSRQWLEFEPHELYERCKAADGHPGANGTIPRVAMDILRTEGMLAKDGIRYTIAAGARIGSTDEIRHALAEQGPVLIGIRINTPDLVGLKVGAFAELEDAPIEGHAMLAVGYDDSLKALRIRNSWGTAWADNGHFWLPYEYLERSDPMFDAWSSIDA